MVQGGDDGDAGVPLVVCYQLSVGGVGLDDSDGFQVDRQVGWLSSGGSRVPGAVLGGVLEYSVAHGSR